MIMWRAFRTQMHILEMLGIYTSQDNATSSIELNCFETHPGEWKAFTPQNWFDVPLFGSGSGVAQSRSDGWFYAVLPFDADKYVKEAIWIARDYEKIAKALSERFLEQKLP